MSPRAESRGLNFLNSNLLSTPLEQTIVMILELCANSFESAQIAQETGLDQIELCENLSVGGVTPERDLIKKVIDELDIPTHVLIRPRNGDFIFSAEEIKIMMDTIRFCKRIGCAGIVSGVLTTNHKIDIVKTQLLMEAAQGMQFTFHRAFDVCKEPLSEVENLKKLGVTRLLTSGQEPTAKQGLSLLKELLKRTENSFQIMPGGGISSENILDFQEAGFTMAHFSAVPKKESAQSLFENKVEGFSNKEEILKIKASLT